jgi:hypothetical protein
MQLFALLVFPKSFKSMRFESTINDQALNIFWYPTMFDHDGRPQYSTYLYIPIKANWYFCDVLS